MMYIQKEHSDYIYKKYDTKVSIWSNMEFMEL
jgi:hypothetical protein